MSFKKYIEDFKDTGANIIDVEGVIEDWDIRWTLNEWRSDGGKWTLIKYSRKDSFNGRCRTEISDIQAKELIDKMGLESVNVMFRSSFEWRTRKDRYSFTKYKMGKQNKKQLQDD